MRNFAIIAHIDHGKTTLTDALLRSTKTIGDREIRERIMDSNPIEQERGITIKLAPVRMLYSFEGQEYQLNLIDTPGHVDFGYEVTRSLAAAEGALLLIDATQGIQAQTLSNYEKARQLGLTIIPVLNKIDLPAADVESATLECMEHLNFSEDEIIKVSAKTGQNIDTLLNAVIEKIPDPSTSLLMEGDGESASNPRALIMTSVYDQHQGVVAYVRVIEGEFNKQNLSLLATETNFMPLEIGFFSPSKLATQTLKAGEVGYIATGIKDIRQVRVGDTLTVASARKSVEPLPGFTVPQPMVYMEIFPLDADDFPALQDAFGKLTLHDAALISVGTHSEALGNGLRVGFLGILHGEIVLERLKREFDLELIATAPSVTYEVLLTNGSKKIINTPSGLPDPSLIDTIYEPMALATIFTPVDYSGAVLQFVQERRGQLIDSVSINNRAKLRCSIPLSEIITDFHDRLKSLTAGFASIEYLLDEYQPIDAVKLSILVNKEPVEALSSLVVRDRAEYMGRKIVAKLKEVVPRQLFEVPIQAAVGGKVVARETVKAYRKDVTAKLYGGDVTRRQKLLKKQAKGKKRLKQFGKVELGQDAFLAVLER